MGRRKSTIGVEGGGGRRRWGFGAGGEICVSNDCKVETYSRPAQAKILKIAGGHREPTHGRARGTRHEPTQAYSRGWTSRRSEATGADEVEAFFGGGGKAGGTVSVLVRGGEGKAGKEVGVAVGSSFAVLEGVSERGKVFQPTLNTRIFFHRFWKGFRGLCGRRRWKRA